MRGHIVKRHKQAYYVVVDLGVDETGKRKQKWISGYRTKADAERGLTEVLGELDRGTYVSPSRTLLGTYLLEEWLPACAARVRPTTVESYRDLIVRLVVPALGAVALADLTPVRITKLYGDLLTSGRSRGPGGLSPRTVRYVHGVLRKALADAVAWRYLSLNPCDAAIPPSAASAKSPEMKTWTAGELRRFLELTKEDREYVAWHLAGCCGLRRGEVCGLRWRDVNLDTDPPTLAVRQQLVESFYQLTFAPPKTARGRRVVVLDDLTAAALRSHRRQQAAERLALGPAYVDLDLVVARLDGSQVHPEAPQV